MSAGWQSCPHCKVHFAPAKGTPASQHCPACRKALSVGAPPSPAKFAPRPRSATLPYELVFALAAILAITAWYFWLARDGAPKPSGFVGHGLGIVGFLMMLATETLYTLRKRLRRFTLWRMSAWLQIHVFTGIVGSYLVLLHSAGKFNGLAGIVALLTLIIVASGFVGRYIYTAVPRSVDGSELATQQLEQQIAQTNRQLQALGGNRLQGEALAIASEKPRRGWMLVLGRGLLRWRHRRRLHRVLRDSNANAELAGQLEKLLEERYRLLMQIDSLAVARRMLSLWHMAHIPLGVVLFTLAFLHVGGALYFATFLR